MRIRLLMSIGAPAAVALALVALQSTDTTAQDQAAALKTPWGDPDLQGIWTDETSTPFQRPARFANQEFFTEEQRTALDNERAGLLGRDKRGEEGSELDVAGAYNAEFNSVKRTGQRTSMVVDPPDGRIPPMTPEGQKVIAADERFRQALMQATETCKLQSEGLPRRQIRSEALAAARGAVAPLQHRAHEPPRRARGRRARGSLPDRRVARVRRRQLPPHRADARRHLDRL